LYGFRPGEYIEGNINEYFPIMILFVMLYIAYYLYLRQVFRRDRMIIDNNEHEIGDEIDYDFHGNVLSYRLIITKVSETDWMAYKIFRSGKKISLRKGDLMKIIDYMNRNFGYDDGTIGFNFSSIASSSVCN